MLDFKQGDSFVIIHCHQPVETNRLVIMAQRDGSMILRILYLLVAHNCTIETLQTIIAGFVDPHHTVRLKHRGRRCTDLGKTLSDLGVTNDNEDDTFWYTSVED